MQLGSLAEWFSGLGAAAIGIYAIIVSKRAAKNSDDIAARNTEWQEKQSARQAELEREIAAREHNRDLLLYAASINAYWVKEQTEGGDWGIIIYNAGAHPMPIYEVNVTLEVKQPNEIWAKQRAQLRQMPPGHYFILSKNPSFASDENKAFPIPLTPRQTESYIPILNSSRHRVWYTFMDAANQRWKRDSKGMLTRLDGKDAQA